MLKNIFQIVFLILLLTDFLHFVQIKKVSTIEKTKEFWIKNGKDQILAKLKKTAIESKAKNIILFIGDGMGISTITTTRIFKNQRMSGSSSPDENLAFENFPNAGMSKTYCVNDYVCDSASTATAILTGVKTNSQVLGLSPRITVKNCKTYQPNEDNLKNIADFFSLQNKSLGIVTTAKITDATPAAIYSNIPKRSWEYKASKKCPFKDIAAQFISKSEMFQVILAGGRKSFLSRHDVDPEYPNVTGSRTDANLITHWKNKMQGKRAQYIWNKEQFENLQPLSTDYVLGLFEPRGLKYVDEENDDPKLDQMATKAIEILSKNNNGFFLLIEEERIDNAHHGNYAYRAILHTLELEKAVIEVLKKINPQETLLILTADHSHVMTLGSYATREADITAVNNGYKGVRKDKRGHTSLLYSNGPSFQSPRENITNSTIFTPQTRYYAGVHLAEESHGGEEVSVYAQGPWAHLLTDVYEQSYIGHVMMYASCTGIYTERAGCSDSYSSILLSNRVLISFILIFRYITRNITLHVTS